MRVNGTLLEVEQSSGTFNNDRGEAIAYDNVVLHILDGITVYKVKARGDSKVAALSLASRKGQTVEVEVKGPERVDFVAVREQGKQQ